jgi:hypothetical protein
MTIPGRVPSHYPHTTECRDDFCVHPIRCELDGTCPPSPGGDAECALLVRETENYLTDQNGRSA